MFVLWVAKQDRRVLPLAIFEDMTEHYQVVICSSLVVLNRSVHLALLYHSYTGKFLNFSLPVLPS